MAFGCRAVMVMSRRRESEREREERVFARGAAAVLPGFWNSTGERERWLGIFIRETGDDWF